jgi:hypothetical protein
MGYDEESKTILEEIKKELGIEELPEFSVNSQKGNIDLLLYNLKKYHDLDLINELITFPIENQEFLELWEEKSKNASIIPGNKKSRRKFLRSLD